MPRDKITKAKRVNRSERKRENSGKKLKKAPNDEAKKMFLCHSSPSSQSEECFMY
jgi:hypothetical protein